MAQFVGRALRAKKQICGLLTKDGAENSLFAKHTDARERAIMYARCLTPLDAPLDIPEFLLGSQQVAQTVHPELFAMGKNAKYGPKEVSSSTPRLDLAKVGYSRCQAVRKGHVGELKRRLKLPKDTRLVPDRLEIKQCGLAGVDYGFIDVNREQAKKVPRNIFSVVETLSVTVRFEVTEHLRVMLPKRSTHKQKLVTCDSVFDWQFFSIVSREEHIEWVVSEATPFRVPSSPPAPWTIRPDELTKS